MYALLNVAFALLAGLLMTRIFSRWRLPDVTAFLVAGVLIGPFCLGRLGIVGVGFPDYESVAALGALSDVEVVVNLFFKSVFVQYYGYVHALVFRAGTNVNVYA